MNIIARSWVPPSDFDFIRRGLIARVGDVARLLLGPPVEESGKFCVFGNNGRWLIVVSGKDAGAWHDYHRRYGDDCGDIFQFIRYVRRCSSAEAEDWSRAFLGIPKRPACR
jgi:hypothetical protein